MSMRPELRLFIRLYCVPLTVPGAGGFSLLEFVGSEWDGRPHLCSAETMGTTGPKHRPSSVPALSSLVEYVPPVALEAVVGYSQTGH